MMMTIMNDFVHYELVFFLFFAQNNKIEFIPGALLRGNFIYAASALTLTVREFRGFFYT